MDQLQVQHQESAESNEDEISSKISQFRKTRSDNIDLEAHIVKSGLKVSLLNMIDKNKNKIIKNSNKCQDMIQKATRIYKEQMKKNKENTDRSLWVGYDTGSESPIGSIAENSDPTQKQSNMNVKALRRQFATRGTVIKKDQQEMAG